MSQSNVTTTVAASLSQPRLVAVNMGDKTPPYVSEDSLPLKEIFAPQSSPTVVRTNSSFCQSLLREMSENSLLLFSKEMADKKDLLSKKSFPGKQGEISEVKTTDSSPPKQVKADDGTPGSKVLVQLEKDQEIASENSNAVLLLQGKASSQLLQNPPDMRPSMDSALNEPMLENSQMTKNNSEISSMEVTSDEPTVDIADVTPKDTSLKRSRTFSDSNEMADTRTTTSSQEEPTEPSGKRLRPLTPEPEANSSITDEVMGSESESKDSEVETSPNSKSENGEEKEETVIGDSEEDEKSNSKNLDKEVEEDSDKSVQVSSPQPDQKTQSGITVTQNRCSICKRINCPLDPNRQTATTPFSTPKTPLVKRLQSSGKVTPLKKNSQFKKVNAFKTQVRRSIGTRSSAGAIRQRTPNHSPLQIMKLKTQLFKAVEMGDLDRVQEVIQETGASVRRAKTGCTLLHVAASHNQVDVVMFLLKLISPNITNKEGQTPAHVAAEKGHTQLLRILMADADFDPDKRDSRRNTIKTLVDDLLFEAVLKGDSGQVKRLVDLGADPDSFGRNKVNKKLTRELGVSSPRQLAEALNMDSAVTLFAKKASSNAKKDLEKSAAPQKTNMEELRMSTRQFHVKASSTYVGGEDVYKMDRDTRGRVYLLNLSSFEKRPDLDLPQLDYDSRLLSDVFGNMGYACETYSGLTAQHTKEMLKNVREAEALSEAGCAIFIVCGYSVKGNGILTSDLKALDVDSVCRFFKDSECPGLKRKPKLFLFNLYHVSSVGGVSPSERPKSMRLEEPVSDTAVLFCKSFGLHTVGKGTGFSSSLCRTLADHAHDKELGDVYREFLTQYTASFPDVAPELRYLGFTKKFFFNPVKH